MARKPIRSVFDVVTASVFSLAIVIPLAAMTVRTEAPDVSTENRLPAPKPDWPADRAALAAFPQAFEKYFNDYFGFRQRLNRLHNVAWFHVFGISPHPIVAAGKERTLFVCHEMDNLRAEKPISHELLAWKSKILQQRHDWLAAQGIKYLVVIVPNKATLYPELAPSSVVPMNPKGPAAQLEEHLKKYTNIPVLNLTHTLAEAKAKGDRQIYPHLDAHWNEYGAYVGYRAIVGKLADWFPGMTPIPQDRCVIEERDAPGDLAHIMGFPDLSEKRLFMRPVTHRSKGIDKWGGVLNQSIESNIDDPTLPRAVIMHDSFMTAERLFLGEHFSKARFRWIYTDFDANAVLETKPHVVIHQMIERTVVNGIAVNPAIVTVPPTGPMVEPLPIAERPGDAVVR